MDGRIRLDDALSNADSANNLRLRIKPASKDRPIQAESTIVAQSGATDTPARPTMSMGERSLEKIEEEEPGDDRMSA